MHCLLVWWKGRFRPVTLIIIIAVFSAVHGNPAPNSAYDRVADNGVTTHFGASASIEETTSSSTRKLTQTLSTSAATTAAPTATHKGLCYYYRHVYCVGNSTAKGIPKELEPSCYPTIVTCRKNLCTNVFIHRDEFVSFDTDGWYGNISISGCGWEPNFRPDQQANIDECKYAASGTYHPGRNVGNRKGVPYDMTRCVCKGILCNRYNKSSVVFHRTSSLVNIGVHNGTTNTTTAAFPEAAESSKCEPQAVLNRNEIAGLATGAIAIAVTLIALTHCLTKKCYQSTEPKARLVPPSDTSSDVTLTSAELDCSKSTSDSRPLSEVKINLKSLTPLIQGRFGKLYKYKDPQQKREVVVKVYDAVDRQYWTNEVEIYESYGIKHDNILCYFGSSQQQSNYLLYLQFHSNGSLRDYLRTHTVDWNEMITILHTMARGIAHLHGTALLSESKIKYPIGHRDIKSSNIILDENCQVKIADFNLAQILKTSTLEGDGDRERVGTSRYMAPEVLSGQVSYTREAVLQADVYSMALVMWEVYSRCAINKSTSEGYHLPYSEYVPDQPTSEEMHQVVFIDNRRPKFPDNLTNPVLSEAAQEIMSTISDSWEKDGDERLTSAGVEARLCKHVASNDDKGIVNTSYM